MTRAARIVPTNRQRSSLAMADSTLWFRMKMLDSTGTTLAYTGRDVAGTFSGTTTVQGTTAGIWTPADGNFHCAGDNPTALGRDIKSICNTAGMVGSLVIFVRLSKATPPTAACFVVNHGNVAFNGRSGWAMRSSPDGRHQFQISNDNNNTTLTPLAGNEYATDASAPSSGIVLVYAESTTADQEITLYNKGVLAGSTTSAHRTDSSYFTLFGKPDGDGAPVATAQLEAGHTVSDLLIVRTAVDVRPYIGAIALEYQRYKYEQLTQLCAIGV